MFDKIRLLKDIPLFSDLGWWDLRRISEKAALESCARGRVVISEGQKGAAFYVILSGRCRMFTRVKTGLARTVGHLRRGDSFGEVALLTGEDYWASVEVTNDVTLLKIEKADFDQLLQKNPRLALKFGEIIAQQLQSVRVTQKEAKWSRLIAVYSPNLPDVRNLFSSSLAASLSQETREPVCLIEFLTTDEGMRTVTDLSRILPRTGHMNKERFQELFVKHRAGHQVLTVRIDDDGLGEKIFSDLLDQLIRNFNYTVMDLPPSVGPTVGRVISQCDRMYLLSDHEDNSLKNTLQVIENFQKEFFLKSEELKLVLCNMPHDARRHMSRYETKLGMPVVTSFDALPSDARRLGVDSVPYVLSHPMNPFSRAVRHLARELSNRLVGLALGVGAARGLAHIGVIRVLERENILIDMIAGSSMGAFVGAIWAMGKNSYEMEEVANRNRGFGFILNLVDPNIGSGFRKGGFFKGKKAFEFLRSVIGDATFADTIIPIKIMATDINGYREVLFQEGRLIDAVRASIAIPGIFEPVHLGDRLLVDGGILNPLPIAPLSRAGVDKIIAINPIPGPDDMPTGGKFAPRLEGYDRLSRSEKLFKRIARNFTGNIFDIIMSSTQIMEYVLAESVKEDADVLIRPVIRDAAWYEFFETGKYIQRGIEETEKSLPDIKRLLEVDGGPAG
ncbi:patatin-like phospholipase family protein [bacterium]|nr:patatin-like phospholipase family protein [bacterium]